MSWHTGTFAAVAEGALIAVLDTVLIQNDNWSIHDAAAGTNRKVYKCEDAGANCLYYLDVNNNYTGYAVVGLWQGWDAVGHAGTGTGLVAIATYAMRIWMPVGAWKISLRDHRFIFINKDDCCTFIGLPTRFDTTKNIPMYLGELTGTTKTNPLGFMSTGNTCGWAFLFDETGTSARLVHPYARQSSYMPRAIHNGERLIIAAWPIYNATTLVVVGVLSGVDYLYDNTGFTTGQTVSVNGVDWYAAGGASATKYFSLIEQA